ncbi:MAG: type II secretion system major pseudopilin GspG [Chloroflexota bacterium]
MSTSNDRRKFDRESGFTLVELLVVLVIIGLLVTISTPRVLQYLASAKVDAARTQISNFESALELYFIDNGTYPSNQQGLEALVSKPSSVDTWNGPYIKLKGQILDPWGNPYVYKHDPSKADVEIISLGSDGNDGGDGNGADITN